jgi:hypothetical protein
MEGVWWWICRARRHRGEVGALLGRRL